jgi:hypothetical protein
MNIYQVVVMSYARDNAVNVYLNFTAKPSDRDVLDALKVWKNRDSVTFFGAGISKTRKEIVEDCVVDRSGEPALCYSVDVREVINNRGNHNAATNSQL